MIWAANQVYADIPAGKYPFDERKDGLKEKMHAWQHFDDKLAPVDALKEVSTTWRCDSACAWNQDASWDTFPKLPERASVAQAPPQGAGNLIYLREEAGTGGNLRA